MKKLLFLLSITLVSVGAFAGGSIFGGHKARTSNPNGVSSIGIHICGNLNCPDVIIQTGDCFTVPHATVKYGVCVCDDGYVAQGEKCVSKEGKCEGVSCTGCQTCDQNTGECVDNDTKCEAGQSCFSGHCMNQDCKEPGCSCQHEEGYPSGTIDEINCSADKPYCARDFYYIEQLQCVSTMEGWQCGPWGICGGDAPYCSFDSHTCSKSPEGMICESHAECAAAGTDFPYCWRISGGGGGYCRNSAEYSFCMGDADCAGTDAPYCVDERCSKTKGCESENTPCNNQSECCGDLICRFSYPDEPESPHWECLVGDYEEGSHFGRVCHNNSDCSSYTDTPFCDDWFGCAECNVNTGEGCSSGDFCTAGHCTPCESVEDCSYPGCQEADVCKKTCMNNDDCSGRPLQPYCVTGYCSASASDCLMGMNSEGNCWCNSETQEGCKEGEFCDDSRNECNTRLDNGEVCMRNWYCKSGNCLEGDGHGICVAQGASCWSDGADCTENTYTLKCCGACKQDQCVTRPQPVGIHCPEGWYYFEYDSPCVSELSELGNSCVTAEEKTKIMSTCECAWQEASAWSNAHGGEAGFNCIF